MRTKLLSSLPTIVVFLAGSHGGSTLAQTYTYSNLYPSSSSIIHANTQITCSGTIKPSPGAPPPNAAKVTIWDYRKAHQVIGTGSVTGQSNGSYVFHIPVRIPSNFNAGVGQCLFQGSTNGGATWNAGWAQTTPTIRNP